MSDSLFSLSSLAIVTPIVALATYIIVLNLDRILQAVITLKITAARASLRSMFLRIGNVLKDIALFGPRIMMSWRTGWRRDRSRWIDDEKRPAPSTNLGDVCVQVQVDVNVERREVLTESSV